MTTETSKATGRPGWRVGDAGLTVFGPPNGNPSPETVAHCSKRGDAALIVERVNGWDALVARIAACEAECDSWKSQCKAAQSESARMEAERDALREALENMVAATNAGGRMSAEYVRAAQVLARAALEKGGAS